MLWIPTGRKKIERDYKECTKECITVIMSVNLSKHIELFLISWLQDRSTCLIKKMEEQKNPSELQVHNLEALAKDKASTLLHDDGGEFLHHVKTNTFGPL